MAVTDAIKDVYSRTVDGPETPTNYSLTHLFDDNNLPRSMYHWGEFGKIPLIHTSRLSSAWFDPACSEPYRTEYYSFQDSVMRIGKSIVFIDKHPVYVSQMDELQDIGPVLIVSAGMTKNLRGQFLVPLFDPRLSLRSISPQYCQSEGTLFFVQRQARRSQKQGSYSENTICTPVVPNGGVPFQGPSIANLLVNQSGVTWDDEIARLLSKYRLASSMRLTPTLAVSRQTMSTQPGSKSAFLQAMGDTNTTKTLLHYAGDDVGFWSKMTNRFIVLPAFGRHVPLLDELSDARIPFVRRRLG